MSSIPVARPYALKTAKVTLQLDDGVAVAQDFSDHVGQITFTPSSSPTSWRSVNSKTIRETSPSEWSVTLGLVQDLDPAGLLRYLHSHDGEKAILVAVLADETQSVTQTVTLTAAQIGGSADGNVASSSVTLPADGKPEWGDTDVDTDPVA